MLRKQLFGSIRRLTTAAQGKQVYLVVGANGGIGSNLTEQLLLCGETVNVAVACRSADSMAKLVQKISEGPAGKAAADRILQIKLDATVPGT
jgi:NAD(P)-dependent dehydrogenase (short-subunit alcohol dehydrogenase family)